MARHLLFFVSRLSLRTNLEFLVLDLAFLVKKDKAFGPAGHSVQFLRSKFESLVMALALRGECLVVFLALMS